MGFFEDTFTEDADTFLDLHTPDVGDGWTLVWPANARLEVSAATDVLKGINGADFGAVYSADATYPSADYELEMTLLDGHTISSRPFYLVVRLQDIENMYAARIIVGGTGTCQLYKKVSGVWSTLGSAFDGPATGSVVKLEIIGDTLKVYDDGVELVSATDTDITAAGKAALGIGGGDELVDSTDDSRAEWEWDTLTITDLAGGITVAVNQVVETDTPQAISSAKAKAIGQNVETDVSQPVSALKTVAVAQATETDLAQAISSAHSSSDFVSLIPPLP